MRASLGLALLLAALAPACVRYEYEHEFWLRVDGSGRVHVTARPALWAAFKGVGSASDPEATREAVRAVFERSGLSVRRVTLTRRQGRPYVFVSADFNDLNRLQGTPAFPDLTLALRREGERLRLEGTWSAPRSPAPLPLTESDGLLAVRFHLPSKVYAHKNAFSGVERGNIVSWRQELAAAVGGGRLELGATLDSRSILGKTVALFASAIVIALALLGAGLYVLVRRGRAATAPTAGR